MLSKWLNTLVLALTVSATPFVPYSAPVKLSISRHLNTTGVHNILIHDRARARYLASRRPGERFTGTVNEPATNVDNVFVASVGVGKPPTQYSLIIDSGSSNTWIGASKAYVKTSTSKVTKNNVSVYYGSSSFSGTEYLDTVTLGSMAIHDQSIGVAWTPGGFGRSDGFLGIGPIDLTQGTLYPDSSATIPTVTDNAFSQGKIKANKIGIFFHPARARSLQTGELTWGGVDNTKFIGPINYGPITSIPPASMYWGINQTITYNFHTILSNTVGILDTGTTFIVIATDAFNRYQAAVGAVMDKATGLLKITPSQYSALKNLDFKIHGKTYSLTPNAQIWPRFLNNAIGGRPGSIYLVVIDIESPSGTGLDFINGYTFLERFYTVFDSGKKQIGFAITPFTTATTN